ncbi:MAG: hydantoinase B/oxoprolinase family protein [Acetobacteraceae bacterium]
MKGAITNTWSYTAAASFTAVRSMLGAEIPNNDGVFRAIRFIAPPGTIANALPPAACAARGLTGFRILDCCLGALAALYPDRVPAAYEGGNTGITIGGYDDRRRPYINVDFLSGAWGGRPWADGIEGTTNMFANMAGFPIEVIEADHPLEVLGRRIVPDSRANSPSRLPTKSAPQANWPSVSPPSTREPTALPPHPPSSWK